MSGGGDKVEENVYTIITEAWVALDSRFLGENVIVLSLKVANDFRKAKQSVQIPQVWETSYLSSLSI